MADVGTRAPRFSLRDITNYQWLVLFVAWAGWSLDITDFTLYGLVLRQALTELLGGTATMAQIGSVGGLLTTIGLLGWAVGGFFFGIIADYLGRVRTLALSILIYSVFTALQGFSQEVWQLGLFRFIAGLGTGAELMIAIPLVAEAFAETHRAKILGFMMTGGGFGNLFAAYIYDWVGPYGWRYVFFFGIFPPIGAVIQATVIVVLGIPALYATGALFAASVLRFGEVAPVVQLIRGMFVLACGITFPVSMLPLWAQVWAKILPPTYIVDDIRRILLRGDTIADVAGDVAIVLSLAVVTGILAVAVFRYLEMSARRTGMLGQF